MLTAIKKWFKSLEAKSLFIKISLHGLEGEEGLHRTLVIESGTSGDGSGIGKLYA